MTVAVKPAADPKAMAVVDELVRRGRAAMAAFADADQARVDEAVTALAWSLYNPAHAKELAELAVKDTQARQRARQDHQEAAQDLRHLARSAAGEVGRHHRGRQEARHRQIRQAGRPRLRDHAVDQSGRDAGQQGDDGDQGPQCHHHRGFARRAEDDHARRSTTCARSSRRSALPEDLVQILPPPASKDMTQALMQAADLVVATGSQDNVRRAYSSGTPAIGVGTGNVPVIVDETADLDDAAQENLRLQDFRQFDVLLVGKFGDPRRRDLRQGDRRARARRRLHGVRAPRRRKSRRRSGRTAS